MEFKKCKRCGCFFVSNNDICCKCSPRDEYDISTLKNYLEDNISASSLEEISNSTGITLKNLNRYMQTDEFKDISKPFYKKGASDGFNNLSINL